MKPRLLDLFCGAGGAGKGYQRAGFEVVGVDLRWQPRYVGEAFFQGDAIGMGRWLLEHHRFDAIHASPPCQRHSTITRRHGRQDMHPDLVGSTRKMLETSGLPWIIENVPGSPLRDPVTLCGSMFGLEVDFDGRRQLRRHRLFESNVPLVAPSVCKHDAPAVGVYGNPGGSSRRDGIRFAGADQWREVMGIDWATAKELAQAIPPAYAEHLGLQLLQHLRASRGFIPDGQES